MITRYINSGSFLAVILCFLLPFLSLKCNGVTAFSVSGTDLVFGTTLTPGNTSSNHDATSETDKEDVDAWPIMIALMVVAVSGFILSFLLKRGLHAAALTCAGLAVVGLIYMYFNVQFKIEENRKVFGIGFPETEVRFQEGYWVLLLLNFGILIYNVIDIANSTRKRDISPVI